MRCEIEKEDTEINTKKNSIDSLINVESYILNKLPNYSDGTKNRCVRKTKELLTKLEYDDDFIEEVNYDFCKGFTVASEIIIEYIKSKMEQNLDQSIQNDQEDIDYNER